MAPTHHPMVGRSRLCSCQPDLCVELQPHMLCLSGVVGSVPFCSRVGYRSCCVVDEMILIIDLFGLWQTKSVGNKVIKRGFQVLHVSRLVPLILTLIPLQGCTAQASAQQLLVHLTSACSCSAHTATAAHAAKSLCLLMRGPTWGPLTGQRAPPAQPLS